MSVATEVGLDPDSFSEREEMEIKGPTQLLDRSLGGWGSPCCGKCESPFSLASTPSS